MWMLAANMPIRLETLDRSGQPLAGVAARLHQMDDDRAQIALEDASSSLSFHWGTPVRFHLEDGTSRYEVTGVVVGRDMSNEEQEHDAGSKPASKVSGLRVRLWDCQLSVQRRMTPRRRSRFPLKYRSLDESDQTSAPESGWCVDIGGGGMRIRIANQEIPPTRVALEFRLPVSGGVEAGPQLHDFSVTARVIRTERSRRRADSMDVSLCFERLSVPDGLALTNLLGG